MVLINVNGLTFERFLAIDITEINRLGTDNIEELLEWSDNNLSNAQAQSADNIINRLNSVLNSRYNRHITRLERGASNDVKRMRGTLEGETSKAKSSRSRSTSPSNSNRSRSRSPRR